MTPEAQRIAIARKMGAKWYRFESSSYTWLTLKPVDEDGTTYLDGTTCHEVDAPTYPARICLNSSILDYLNSLDACHEFEKTLSDDEYYHFLDCLDIRRRVSASATARCEAFLRTKGLWEESK